MITNYNTSQTSISSGSNHPVFCEYPTPITSYFALLGKLNSNQSN